MIYKADKKLSTLLRELSWSHHLLLIGQCKTAEERYFYANRCIGSRWSVRELQNQLKADTFERTMLADAKLPPAVKNLPQNVSGVFKGDPNQSIFAFAGSSADYMNSYFVKDYSPQIIELKENYRSSKRVIEAAEKIIPDTCVINNMVIPGDFKIYKAKDEMDESFWINNMIVELINTGEFTDIEGKIEYEKISVVARNKYIFKTLTNDLTANNIPFYYKVTPGPIKYESDLFKIFDLAFAFTRAKRFLYVTWPEIRTMPWGDSKIRSRSRFLNKFDQ